MMKYIKFILHWFQVKLFPSSLIPEQRFSIKETREEVINNIKQSKNFLEYGGGWSTKIAADSGISFLTIESDKNFADYLSKKIVSNSSQIIQFVDIGLTSRWGYPLFFSTSKNSIEKYKTYTEFPFHESTAKNHFDLVMIDGRFRVACFFQVLINFSKKRIDTKVIFDDFFVDSRRSYQVIFSYIKKFDKHGSVCIIEINKENIIKFPSLSDLEEFLEDPT